MPKNMVSARRKTDPKEWCFASDGCENSDNGSEHIVKVQVDMIRPNLT